jgi:hypothetical protein
VTDAERLVDAGFTFEGRLIGGAEHDIWARADAPDRTWTTAEAIAELVEQEKEED